MMKQKILLLALIWVSPSCTVALDTTEPYEVFCTSEANFNADTTVIYECFGTDSQACEDAGGFYIEEDSLCADINPFSSEECDAISGFSSSPNITCQEVASYASSIRCSDSLTTDDSLPTDFDSLPTDFYLTNIQSTCCGGEENYLDFCADAAKNSYKAFCTSEADFNSDAGVIYGCFGTDSQACEDAGGFYIEEDSLCEDINPFSSEECDAISGFSSSPLITCQEVAPYASSLPCSDSLTTDFYLPNIQSTCCGGEENYLDFCPGVGKPYEAFCTSEADYNSDAVVFIACRGTESQACEDAGGSYNAEETKCDDIDTLSSKECDAIPGFTYDSAGTCQTIASLVPILDCNDAYNVGYYLSIIQPTCCGGEENYLNFCPGTTVSPTKTPAVSPIITPTKTPAVSPTVLSTKIPAVFPTTLPTTPPTATSTVSSTMLPTKSQATLPTTSPSSSSEATPTVVPPTDSQTESATSLNTSPSSSFDALCSSIFIVVISLLFTLL